MSDPEEVQVELDVCVLHGLEVLPGEAAGFKVVFVVLEAQSIDGVDHSMVLALPREDAIKMVESIKSIAATVPPINKQVATATSEESK